MIFRWSPPFFEIRPELLIGLHLRREISYRRVHIGLVETRNLNKRYTVNQNLGQKEKNVTVMVAVFLVGVFREAPINSII